MSQAISPRTRRCAWWVACALLLAPAGESARSESSRDIESDAANPPAEYTPIYRIQGAGVVSPLAGQSVTTRGVVTAVFPGLLGYTIQDETGDGDPATSDGIFVYAHTQALDVSVGDRIQLTGTVSEYAAYPGDPTLTEIVNPTLQERLGSGTIAPTPIRLPVAEGGELERYEGMLVTITSPLSVSQNYFLGRYGQLTLSAGGRLFKPTNLFRPESRAARALAEDNARRRIVLDDGQAAERFVSAIEHPSPVPYLGADGTLRAGDTVDSLTGIIDSGRVTSAMGVDAVIDYRLHPTVTPVFKRVNRRPQQPPEVGGRIRIASFNLLNFFTSLRDGHSVAGAADAGCLPSGTLRDCRGAANLAEYSRQRDKLVRALAAMNADVVGLLEVQRNSGVAAKTLVGALNAYLGREVYAVVPEPGQVGSDAIQVALIYKPATLWLDGAARADLDPVHSRVPLAQTFRVKRIGARFGVILAHFKSKHCEGADGDDFDADDGQGCYNDRRKRQARALLSFVEQVKGASDSGEMLVLGDLNAYAKEDPLDILTSAGLQDQVSRFDGPGAYSFVFDGEAGAIDHALATPPLAKHVTGASHWHINADEPAVLDYRMEFKSQDLYSATPYRSSDHDPVLVGLDLRRRNKRSR